MYVCANTRTTGIAASVENGEVKNDPRWNCSPRNALSHARAGAVLSRLSDMMTAGRAIRKALDGAGFEDIAIMSYAAKYCSDSMGRPRGGGVSAAIRRPAQLPDGSFQWRARRFAKSSWTLPRR